MSRLLVVAPNWIGDALMAQPLLACLRAREAGTRIDVLASERVAPLFRRMEEVAQVIATTFRQGGLQLRERRRLGRTLRARGYAEAIVLPNSWKSALVPFFAGIPTRTGYVGEARYGLLNRRLRAPARSHGMREPMSAHYARLADPGARDAPAALPRPCLKVNPALARANADRFGYAPRGNVVLCPGAEYGPAKRWPAERFGALAAALAARGARVWLLGATVDAPACDATALAAGPQHAGRITSLAGRTTLDEAIDLVAAADFVVSNDSGLMHVAAALDRPQVALFGSSSPAHTPPQSDRARTLWLGLACSPCFARECPLGHLRCLREIDVGRVLGEIERLAVLD